jgi:hypothetical protein
VADYIQGVPGGMWHTSGECFFMLKYTHITENTYIQSVRYYPRFHVTAVGLVTYYP